MASKNPNNDIAAKIALNGGYDPCPTYRLGGAFWDANEGCDPGFVPDYTNGYCYMVLPGANFTNILQAAFTFEDP
jgi:hypothetical protein